MGGGQTVAPQSVSDFFQLKPPFPAAACGGPWTTASRPRRVSPRADWWSSVRTRGWAPVSSFVVPTPLCVFPPSCLPSSRSVLWLLRILFSCFLSNLRICLRPLIVGIWRVSYCPLFNKNPCHAHPFSGIFQKFPSSWKISCARRGLCHVLRLTDGVILHRVPLGGPLRANPAAAVAPWNHFHSIQILFLNSKPLLWLMSFDQDSTPVINYGYGGRCVLFRYHHWSHQRRLSAWICKV